MASLHLAPTRSAAANLLAEGVAPDSIVVTGNTVIDALRATLALRPSYQDPTLDQLDASDRRILLVTAHRRESWEGGLRRIAEALIELTRRVPDLTIVFPVHPNPVVANAVVPLLADEPRILLTQPLEYGAFVRLMARADLILTDSGGIQEEGPALGTPTLVARATTERPEALAAGGACLVGTDPRRIVREVTRLLADRVAYDQMASSPSPFGDGHAAARVVQAMRQLVDLGQRWSDAPTSREMSRPRPSPTSRRQYNEMDFRTAAGERSRLRLSRSAESAP
jgi:UDP-N-acetylglucosamine 2-epimerase (non-hydrolysing)